MRLTLEMIRKANETLAKNNVPVDGRYDFDEVNGKAFIRGPLPLKDFLWWAHSGLRFAVGHAAVA